MARKQLPPDDKRPPRVELFAFYYLGINPDGGYRFPNVHHVAAFYNAAVDDVHRWLVELELESRVVLRRRYNLGAAQADLMLEADALMPHEVMARAEAILADVDAAKGDRRPWEDEPG